MIHIINIIILSCYQFLFVLNEQNITNRPILLKPNCYRQFSYLGHLHYFNNDITWIITTT